GLPLIDKVKRAFGPYSCPCAMIDATGAHPCHCGWASSPWPSPCRSPRHTYRLPMSTIAWSEPCRCVWLKAEFRKEPYELTLVSNFRGWASSDLSREREMRRPLDAG